MLSTCGRCGVEIAQLLFCLIMLYSLPCHGINIFCFIHLLAVCILNVNILLICGGLSLSLMTSEWGGSCMHCTLTIGELNWSVTSIHFLAVCTGLPYINFYCSQTHYISNLCIQILKCKLSNEETLSLYDLDIILCSLGQ